MEMLNEFYRAIDEKKIVEITFRVIETNSIETRICVPFDFAESKRYRDGIMRYHFYDLNSPTGKTHNLSIKPQNLIRLIVTDTVFNPSDYITWKPTNWTYKRNWGDQS